MPATAMLERTVSEQHQEEHLDEAALLRSYRNRLVKELLTIDRRLDALAR